MDATTTPAGRLIMIDGPDGVGKTTQLRRLSEALQAQGREVYTTRIMGGTPIGEELRKVIFTSHYRPAVTNLHIAEAIYYALADDLAKRQQANPETIILVDRSPLTMMAYQQYGDGVDKDLCRRSCNETMKAFQPDLVIVYTVDETTRNARRSHRTAHENSDYFEHQSADYFARVSQGYDAASALYHATTLDASGSVDAIHAETLKHVTVTLSPH